MKRILVSVVAVFLVVALAGCQGGELTTREKGAGIGTVVGAGLGGIIGAAVGCPGCGAGIGAATGLAAGALVGDYMQGQEKKQAQTQTQIDQNQAEINRQHQEIDQLKKEQEY
jgi:outer membrane lipoprotein SlyB